MSLISATMHNTKLMTMIIHASEETMAVLDSQLSGQYKTNVVRN